MTPATTGPKFNPEKIDTQISFHHTLHSAVHTVRLQMRPPITMPL